MSRRKKRKRRNKAADAMTFMHLTAGKWVAQALAVAAELGIADLLKRGSKTAATIARPLDRCVGRRHLSLTPRVGEPGTVHRIDEPKISPQAARAFALHRFAAGTRCLRPIRRGRQHMASVGRASL